jgi:Lipopolysaccharide-assembly
MRLVRLVASALLGAALAGCAGYRLGPTGGQGSGERSIQVNFFKNQTIEPRLVEAVAQALRRNLQQDGTYRLRSGGDADLIVNGVIIRYERVPVSFQPTDVISVQDYEEKLIARVTATERISGKTVLDREITGRTMVSVGTDLPSAERQAIPLLADDLARNATTYLAEGSW